MGDRGRDAAWSDSRAGIELHCKEVRPGEEVEDVPFPADADNRVVLAAPGGKAPGSRSKVRPGGVRVEVGDWVIWERVTPVLRGLVAQSKDFRTAKEAFCARLNGEYFLKCANVGDPFKGCIQRASSVAIISRRLVTNG